MEPIPFREALAVWWRIGLLSNVPLVVLGAGAVGFLGALRPEPEKSRSQPQGEPDLIRRPGTKRAALLCLLLWGLTLGLLQALLGEQSVFTQISAFFSKMAVVTFGEAYALLAYVAQQGVEHYRWLQPGEMLDGLGLAETTPGPLILVTQFVGFLAGYRGSPLQPALLAATLGALLTTWVTFLPCFLWIFAGAPYVEKLRSHRPLSAALAAITAAVVGVIANLALWFALNALFAQHSRVSAYGLELLVPDPGSLNLALLVLSAVAFLLVFVLKMRILPLLGTCTLLSMGWTLLRDLIY